MPTLIKFTQGATTDDFGRAVVGTIGVAVVCTNSLGVAVRYKLVDKHPNSALSEGQFAQGVSGSFTPDKAGGTYQVIITDLDDNELDRRDFIVPTAAGRLIPADSSTHATFNYGGQAKGWANTVADVLRRQEGITAAVMTDAPKVLNAVESANRIIFVTSSVPLTAARDFEILLGDEDWRIFRNETTGGFDINVKINGGTPAAIPNGKSHIVFRKGTVIYHADEDSGGAGSAGTVTNPGFVAYTNDTNNYQPNATQLQSGIHEISGQTAERTILYPRNSNYVVRNAGNFDLLVQGQTGGAGSGTIVRINPGNEVPVYFDSTNARPVGGLTAANVATPNFSSDANLTIASQFYQSDYMRFTSSGSLTVARNAEQPLERAGRKYVENATTGGQDILFGSSSGNKVRVPHGLAVEVVCNGTDWRPIGAFFATGTNATYPIGGLYWVNPSTGNVWQLAA